MRRAEPFVSIIIPCYNAKLKVIGSGKVYDRGATLGRYGIDQADYEDRFMRYLTDENGEILPSVEFLGLMGAEKFEVMRKATVGVVNPTGLTENCPGSALEFQACGVPVVSAAKGGLRDTVADAKTGILVRDTKGLSEAIVRLLTDQSLNEQMGAAAQSFVSGKFGYDSVCRSWASLLDCVVEDKNISTIRMRPKPYFWQEKRMLRILIGLFR
ncbi:glycosyltransferase [Rubritalea sp.]|uniref:glycosyltransferase n=1 Tax=Rubritalea sp. TaxID=2109375 RepID=UPI003EF852C2